jgi:signal transduction histidine kinase
MAGQTDAHTPGRPDAGWLLTHVDGLIVAADEASARLLHATSRDALVGRNWPSLVATPDRSIATAALGASRAGASWSGGLRFVFGLDATPLHVEVAPTGGDPPMLVVRLAPPAPTASPPAFEEQHDAAALVVALDAEGALGDDAAAAYAVLQALARVVRFEWAAVLRFDDAAAAQVIGTFPTPMGGVGPGSVWSPLDAVEAALVTDREPRLDIEVGRTPGSPSPLDRLPAFGLTSRLLIPLFEGAAVVGAVACYAPAHAPFRPIDGLRVERFARRLGQRLGQRMQRLTPQPPGANPPASGPPPPPQQPDNPLEDPSAPLDEVVAEVAHQLNNPLTSILGYAQLLPSLPEEDRAAALVTIEQEAERAARMVRNLLAFGREQPAPDAPPAPPAEAAARVLVASSDGPLVTLASEVLAGRGYIVDVMPTAEGAREQARVAGYTAILLDAALDPGGRFAAAIEAETPALAGRVILVVAEGFAAPEGRLMLSRGRLSAELPDMLANLGQ